MSRVSSNKFDPKSAPIRFDPAAAFVSAGLSRDNQVALVPRLEAARREVLAELDQARSKSAIGAEGQGGAAEIIDLPERMLGDYRQRRGKSELGRILATAKRLRETVDRVVTVGSESDCLAARALFEACCHPYHNEQGRGDRGGRPRIYFAGSEFDNDALQGLLDLLGHGRTASTIDDRWGVIAIGADGPATELAVRPAEVSTDEPGGVSPRTAATEPIARPVGQIGNAEDAEIAENLEASATLKVLLDALRQSCGGEDEAQARLFVPVSRAGGPAVFSAVGLLPGSVMGLDVVRLLEGAAAMNERFRTAPIGDNPPLDFAMVGQLMRNAHGTAARRFAMWGRGLMTLVTWCERMRESRISDFKPQISDFKSEIHGLRINLVVESVRRDRIVVGATQHDDDQVDNLAGKTLPELNAAAIQAAKAADKAAGRPSVDIRLPALDEGALGQLFQMLILTTAIERRLAGVQERAPLSGRG